MGRNSDWSPLERAYDPTPGDPTIVSNAAEHYGLVAESIKDAKVALEGVFAEGVLDSQAVQALSGEALKVAERIGRAYDRYNGVAVALAGYVEPLTTAQTSADTLLTNAIAMLGDGDEAQTSIRYWEDERDQARDAGDTTAEQYAEGRITYYEEARDGAESWLHTARYTTLPDIEDERDRAAQAAADAIELVQDSGDLNDGFWENVDQFFEENPWVNDFMNALSWIGAGLAVIAMFIPGLNVIVGIIAAVTVLVTLLQMFSGNKSPLEGILGIALAIVPFGAGRLLGPVLRTSGSNVLGAAVTSTMRSAAGSGVSGVTRVVATNTVNQGLSRIPSFIAAGSQGRTFLEISVMALTPMRSGSLSSLVGNAMLPGGLAFAGLAGAEFVEPTVSSIVQNTDAAQDSTGAWDLQDHNW